MGVLVLVIVCVCVSESAWLSYQPLFVSASHNAQLRKAASNAAPLHAFDQHAITDVVMQLGELLNLDCLVKTPPYHAPNAPSLYVRPCHDNMHTITIASITLGEHMATAIEPAEESGA